MPDDESFEPVLQTTIAHLLQAAEALDKERLQRLQPLVRYVADRKNRGQPVALTFICTHNSRRSQFAQVWAATAAAYFGIEGVDCHSGGTEVTACNPRTVAALRRAGFRVDQQSGDSDNPRYVVSPGERSPDFACFSKLFDDASLPKTEFAAVMTCGAADERCPVVPGATRIPVTYDDPKVADGTDAEVARYNDCCQQIGRDMLRVFGAVAQRFP